MLDEYITVKLDFLFYNVVSEEVMVLLWMC
jgi:hypothetical protein